MKIEALNPPYWIVPDGTGRSMVVQGWSESIARAFGCWYAGPFEGALEAHIEFGRDWVGGEPTSAAEDLCVRRLVGSGWIPKLAGLFVKAALADCCTSVEADRTVQRIFMEAAH